MESLVVVVVVVAVVVLEEVPVVRGLSDDSLLTLLEPGSEFDLASAAIADRARMVIRGIFIVDEVVR